MPRHPSETSWLAPRGHKNLCCSLQFGCEGNTIITIWSPCEDSVLMRGRLGNHCDAVHGFILHFAVEWFWDPSYESWEYCSGVLGWFTTTISLPRHRLEGNSKLSLASLASPSQGMTHSGVVLYMSSDSVIKFTNLETMPTVGISPSFLYSECNFARIVAREV